MGEAKRRAGATQIGVIGGSHAEDPEIVTATVLAVSVLEPIVIELARRADDWRPVLNALTTLLINSEIALCGVAKTEQVLQELIRQLPEFARHQLFAGGTAGSA